MHPCIEVRGVRKRYRSTVAVDGLSFSVRPGEVTGFVGPNGAGKSTTMRIIMGLDAPDEGVALVAGQAAITLGVVLVLLPVIVGLVLPGTPALWLMRTTLAGGLATQRAQPPSLALAEPWSMIGPWAGFTVVAAYAAIAFCLAWWRLRRSDA
jgi:energy-coupling factor transporter ATP-binding protein EcfA2